MLPFAGLRVGYGAFPKCLIEYMWRAKQPYNVSVASETAARAALSNPVYLDEVGQRVPFFGILLQDFQLRNRNKHSTVVCSVFG